MRWFGPSWGAVINIDCPHSDTPVGTPCGRCTVPITEGDAGVSLPFMSGDPASPSHIHYHRNCFRKTVMDHRFWPQAGLVPDATDGFVADDELGVVRCPTCGMRYSVAEARWL